jgi:PAS domain S-box-containing protein
MKPVNEQARLEALRSYEVLDTPPEPSFDDITQLAAQLCSAPISLIALIDEERVWLKSRTGVDTDTIEVPRDLAFCGRAVSHPGLHVVPDALVDPQLAQHPLVAHPPHLRFYAGAPLITPEGATLGTVCVVDVEPRQLTQHQLRGLEALARQVVSQLELRRMNLVQTRLIAELQASSERFSVIQHATNDIVWDWDLPAGRVSWSDRVTEVLGYPPQDVRQDSGWWPSLVHPDDRDRVAEGFRRAVQGGKTLWSDEYRLRRANGTYARVLDRGVIANLDYARQEAEAAAGPENSMAGAELPRALREAREGAERVRLIVRDLKTFSRPDDARMEQVDLRRAIDSAVTLAWNEIRHRARLVKVYQQVPEVWANEARLGQVFLNLLINAAHSIPEGAADRNEIRVSTRVDGQGRVVAEVRDTGAGIPEDIRSRVLEPFFTTKPPGEGTGLGLSICHSIVTSLGGELRFTSEVGKGTTFRVVLSPRTVEDGERSAEKVVKAVRRVRILAVDDEQMVLNALKRTLGSEHDVTLFTRAQAALAWLEQGEPWDLILCDLMMPEMTGMEFHAELSRRMPERVRDIIFVTGGAFTAGSREFLSQITNIRVEKPFDPKELRQLIHTQLQER